jgi:hypothetical protein
MSFQSSARRHGILALVTLAVAACGGSGFYVPPLSGPAGSSPGAPGAGGTTAWETATRGIGRDGSVSLDTALAAFSVVYGPLPGVAMPAGDPAFVGSGSGPVRWLLGHWNELSTEQQAAALPFFDPRGSAATVPDIQLVAAHPGAGSSAGPVLGAPIEAFQNLANSLKPQIEAKIKRKLKLPYEIVFRNLPVVPGKVVFAETVPVDPQGQAATATTETMRSCQIQINTRGQQLEEVDDQTALIAHELFHCFQYELAAKVGDVLSVAPWIDEGSAAWVGEQFTTSEIGSTIGQQFWVGWLREPEIPLFGRAYDAIGFYAHLVDSGIDPWPLLDKIEQQALATHRSAEAYFVTTKAKGGEKMIDAWGPSLIRDVALGADWNTAGKGLPPTITTPVAQETLANDDQIVVFMEPLTAAALRVDVKADVFVLKGLHGRGFLRLPGGTQLEVAKVLGLPFCAKPGGCTCPKDSPGEHHRYQATTTGMTLFGFTGHDAGVDLDILSYSVDSACDNAPEDFIAQPPCLCPPGPIGFRDPRARLA